MTNHGVTRDTLERLAQFDTCTLSNAVERLNVRPRNEGFTCGSMVCRFPFLRPVVGYAVTARIRSYSPPVSRRCYYENMEWWQYVAASPAPRIVVLQDCDERPGFGALFGEIHARICRALDCVACITNGSVRDLDGIEALGFQLYSGSVSVSHAYAHVIEFGHAAEVGGLRIASGDLLHGDRHGVLSLPGPVAADLPAVAEHVLSDDREMFELCDAADFSLARLREKIQQPAEARRCY